MQKTFLLNKITPFFKNIRKEITKSPVYYFNDLGLRNYALGAFGNISLSGDTGHLFENFIFNILREKIRDSAAQIHFWRTKDKAEVDFVLCSGLKTIPIEIKYREIKTPEMTRSFQSFLTKYNPDKGYIIHLGSKIEGKKDNVIIYFLPYYRLLFESLGI